jgi:hypothetical protein
MSDTSPATSPPPDVAPLRPRGGDAWEAVVREELVRLRRRSRHAPTRSAPQPRVTDDSRTTPPAAA